MINITINIDQPSGSTMIIINNGQSSSHAPSTSHPFTHSAATHTDFPSDIAQGPLQSPRMKFRSHLQTLVTKRDRLVQELQVARRKMQHIGCLCATTTRSADTFTCTGFWDWKHATGQSGMLLKHDLPIL